MKNESSTTTLNKRHREGHAATAASPHIPNIRQSRPKVPGLKCRIFTQRSGPFETGRPFRREALHAAICVSPDAVVALDVGGLRDVRELRRLQLSAYGGRWQRDDPINGRVGSIFAPAGAMVIGQTIPAEDVPAAKSEEESGAEESPEAGAEQSLLETGETVPEAAAPAEEVEEKRRRGGGCRRSNRRQPALVAPKRSNPRPAIRLRPMRDTRKVPRPSTCRANLYVWHGLPPT